MSQPSQQFSHFTVSQWCAEIFGISWVVPLFHSTFLNNCSTFTCPQTKKKSTWIWEEECQWVFNIIKQDLIQVPVRLPPDFNRPFRVQMDASEIGLGAVLTKKREDGERVISYASRLLRGAEKSYSVSEKECLAVIWAVEIWRPYLEGRTFEVITDHTALHLGISTSQAFIATYLLDNTATRIWLYSQIS